MGSGFTVMVVRKDQRTGGGRGPRSMVDACSPPELPCSSKMREEVAFNMVGETWSKLCP